MWLEKPRPHVTEGVTWSSLLKCPALQPFTGNDDVFIRVKNSWVGRKAVNNQSITSRIYKKKVMYLSVWKAHRLDHLISEEIKIISLRFFEIIFCYVHVLYEAIAWTRLTRNVKYVSYSVPSNVLWKQDRTFKLSRKTEYITHLSLMRVGVSEYRQRVK
jgi:hypothetical protein